MYQSERLEIWNLTPGLPVLCSAQKIFNIVGRLKSPSNTIRLSYSLNDGPEKSVFFNPGPERSGRLQNTGDFNIDTIIEADLKETNRLVLKVYEVDESIAVDEISFSAYRQIDELQRFRLSFEGISEAHEVGQVVDGNWRVSSSSADTPCLEITREESGLDRIILFGRHDWTTGYTITADLEVTAWTAAPYNVGLVYKWNEHLQGDGTCLPTQWSTGLGYFSSYDPALRIRFGDKVHIDKFGNKVGDYVLRDGHLSTPRYWAKRFLQSRWGQIIPRRLLPFNFPFTEIVPGRKYTFKMRVNPKRYELTVWQSSKKEPQPLLQVSHPTEHLPKGSAGIIAYNCGVRVHSFTVESDP